MTKLPNVSLSSWRDERLAEMFWATLLVSQMTRDDYLQLFREISERCADLEGKDWGGLGHTKLAEQSDDDFDKIVEPIAKREQFQLLSALSLFPDLPDAHHWARHVPNWEDPPERGYEDIALAVGLTSWHQSEAATDIRWLRVLSMILGGKVHFVGHTAKIGEEIVGFPDVGDMKAVRPAIRAAEQSLGSVEGPEAEEGTKEWTSNFWKQCKTETACIRAEPKRPTRVQLDGLFDNVVDVYRDMERHFHHQESFEAIDEKLDAVFGLTFYGLNLVLNLIAGNSYRRVEGRLIIRSLCECYIVLSYLLKVDSEKTWKQYRNYGQGQAKLAYLKSIDIESGQKPKFYSEEDLEDLANEDKWEEFLDIDLGSWSKKNLRSMSEDAGVKDVYDRYYGWASGYVHGHWSAVRDTVFDLCLNPLHRLHRIPAIPRANMNDCSEDSVKLLNLILEKLNQTFPTFKGRVKFPRQA
ncbi:DUF5677 domain-containing protein [Qipengyuania aquimaris]|uniref:Uncharacterized protein n=1 Tax=Qipengyuania aquimaris TaxID=255984 RepID=A0A9Q3S0I7_9SPHN|nr:DUF5677 domain-containing protein [Qipengyuania aquimaris]MBY6217939.1 hypothetical protein [Qipengyuania aquimaris]